MKKFLSVSLIALFLASALAGCTEVDPKRVGQADGSGDAKGTLKADLVDQLLAPPTAKDLYEDKTILKMSAGKATVQHSNGVEVEVDSDYPVVPGDTIIVQMGGAGTVLWFDDSISRLKEGTILTIDKADFDANDITKTDINFHVVKGEIWNKVRGLVNPDSEFLSYAGSVVSGVRGSVYNLVVNGDDVTVESVEHSAFLAPVDLKTNTIGKEKRIVRGQLAKSISKKSIQVGDISPKRLKEGWFEENKVEDKSAVKLLKEKNMERLARRVGALPGEPGYEEKMNKIEDRLSKIKDPDQLAELNSRFAQLKARESIVVALKGPTDSNADTAATRLDALRSALDTKGLSDSLRKQIRAEAQIELQGLDRSMEEVLPDTKGLYDIKQSLRQQQMDLAPDKDQLKAIKERVTERRFFDLKDVSELSNNKLPKDLQGELDAVQKDLRGISDFWQNNPMLEQGLIEAVKGFKANPADGISLDNIQNFIEDPAVQLQIREAQKIMEQALPTIQEFQGIAPETLPDSELPTEGALLRLPDTDLAEIEPIAPVDLTLRQLPSDDTGIVPIEPVVDAEIAPETLGELPIVAPPTLNLLNTRLPLIR